WSPCCVPAPPASTSIPRSSIRAGAPRATSTASLHHCSADSPSGLKRPRAPFNKSGPNPMSERETIHLAADISFIHTDYLWRMPGSWAGYPYYSTSDFYEDIARIAERGKMDML